MVSADRGQQLFSFQSDSHNLYVTNSATHIPSHTLFRHSARISLLYLQSLVMTVGFPRTREQEERREITYIHINFARVYWLKLISANAPRWEEGRKDRQFTCLPIYFSYWGPMPPCSLLSSVYLFTYLLSILIPLATIQGEISPFPVLNLLKMYNVPHSYEVFQHILQIKKGR